MTMDSDSTRMSSLSQSEKNVSLELQKVWVQELTILISLTGRLSLTCPTSTWVHHRVDLTHLLKAAMSMWHQVSTTTDKDSILTSSLSKLERNVRPEMKEQQDLVNIIPNKRMHTLKARFLTSTWDLRQAVPTPLLKVAMSTLPLASMMTDSVSTLTSSLSQLERKEQPELQRAWVLELTILISLTVKLSLRCPTSTWVQPQADLIHSLKAAMSMWHQANMTMESASTPMLSLSRSRRSVRLGLRKR